ncbi:nuclear transport factor 2 family protein [Nocardia aurantia]|uniref:SnoaL-like domain-containing protein n=1 Tax=Nocardia aurantia TaxID=2585199 RepID=A0A7K0DRN0_9NOCA|nr:nuclear transport factor 2 family protein [Nocardia aurantia]MQY28391.1 hypothetical protein [Nocardia aurantia]
MLDEQTVQKLLWHWDEGWNSGDLDTIMSPFATDVLFSSPFVPKLLGDPARLTLEGAGPLRDYVRYALEHAPGIRYTVDGSYSGTDTLVIVYTCHNPDGSTRNGSDFMRVGPDGTVAEWRCHYFREPDL